MANIEHEALAYGEGHVIHFAEYANATAREDASGLTSGDDHKVALQTDDHSFWVLTDYIVPTWVPMFGTPGDDTVTGAKIVDDAIDSEHYTDGSIDTAHLSADCVDDTKIGDAKVKKEHINADVAGTGISGGAGTALSHDAHTGDVTGATVLTIANQAVTQAHIQDGQITKVKLNADVAGTGISGGAGTALSHDAHTGAVTGATVLTIANQAVTQAHIQDGQITKVKLNADVAGAGLTGGAGTPLSVDGIVEQGASAELKVKVIEIGDWNMDAVPAIEVAHGLTFANIRTISVLIRNDGDTIHSSFGDTFNDAGATYQYTRADATNVKLNRSAGGYFDSTGYDVMGGDGNRGWITIFYIA